MARDDDAPDSDVLLQRALRTYPSAAAALFERNGGLPPSIDSAQVLQRNHFRRSLAHVPSLEHLVALLAERNRELWRGDDIARWFVDNATVVAEEVRARFASVRERWLTGTAGCQRCALCDIGAGCGR